MYNPLKGLNIKKGATVLGITGAVAGGVAGGLVGVAVPAYVGWELGDYIKNALEFGSLIGYCTNVLTAIGLTSICGGLTVPLGVVVGGATGGAVGAGVGAVCGAVGAGVDKTKESLESLVSEFSEKSDFIIPSKYSFWI